MINFSVVHQISSQTLPLPPRREVEVCLWGYSQLKQPLAHLLAVMLYCTLGLQTGAGSSSCCRGRSCTIQGAASGYVRRKQIKRLWLCLVTSKTGHQMWAVLAVPTAAVLRDSSSGWTLGDVLAQRKLLLTNPAMPSLLCSVVTSPPVWDTLPVLNLATSNQAFC